MYDRKSVAYPFDPSVLSNIKYQKENATLTYGSLRAFTTVRFGICRIWAAIFRKFKLPNYLLFHSCSLERPLGFLLLMSFVLRISLVNKEKALRRLNAECGEIDMLY